MFKSVFSPLSLRAKCSHQHSIVVQYTRLSRGRPGFNSPCRSFLFFGFLAFSHVVVIDAGIILE